MNTKNTYRIDTGTGCVVRTSDLNFSGLRPEDVPYEDTDSERRAAKRAERDRLDEARARLEDRR